MKELLQVVDVEKCIALGKRAASLIIVSILMIDAVNAMEYEDPTAIPPSIALPTSLPQPIEIAPQPDVGMPPSSFQERVLLSSLRTSRDPSKARSNFQDANPQGKLRLGEEAQREKFDHNLTRLKEFLGGASDTLIEELYSNIKDAIAGTHSEEDLTAQQAFAAVSCRLSLGDEV